MGTSQIFAPIRANPTINSACISSAGNFSATGINSREINFSPHVTSVISILEKLDATLEKNLVPNDLKLRELSEFSLYLLPIIRSDLVS